MDVEEYAAARYGRLVERAVELGAPEERAGEYVDQVLRDQRRAIKRADDPDPLVHEALARAITGEPARRSRTGAFVALGVVGVAVIVTVALTYQPSPQTVPSLFGYQSEAATELLEAQGYDVVLRQSSACDPLGHVLATHPRAGTPVQDGAPVSVFTAVPYGSGCETRYLNRSDAWEFIAFARGGPAPALAETVHVIVDRSERATMSGADAARQARWGGTLQLLADAADTVVPTGSGMARLRVTAGAPPPTTCGVARPIEGGERSVLRLEIDTRRTGSERGCPLTIDLYRVDRVIDAVVIYTAVTPGDAV